MNWRAVALILLGTALLVWSGASYIREVVALDVCLDAGGSYDYVESRCDHTRSHPSMGYPQRHPASVAAAALGAFLFAAGIVQVIRIGSSHARGSRRDHEPETRR